MRGHSVFMSMYVSGVAILSVASCLAWSNRAGGDTIIGCYANALSEIGRFGTNAPSLSTFVLAVLGSVGLAAWDWRWSAIRQATAGRVVVAFAGVIGMGIIPAIARGQIFVTNFNAGTMSEYSTAGATIHANLISGLNEPNGIAISGANIFVLNYGTSTNGNYNPASGSIGEYTTSGATVNAALVTGLQGPEGIAISGQNLFVVSYDAGTISEYTTSGATVNAALITGLFQPLAIAASGGDLFVTNYSTSAAIAEYTTAGTTVNAALVSDLYNPYCIAASGSKLFARAGVFSLGEYDDTTGATVNANLIPALNAVPVSIAISGVDMFVLSVADGQNTSSIGQYTATSGATVNASLITQLDGSASAIAVVPEPNCVVFATLGFFGVIARRRRFSH